MEQRRRRQVDFGTGIHEFPVYNKTSGLADYFSAERVGDESLVTANNVVIDGTGQISSRQGMTALSSSRCHSLFSCGSYGFCVVNGVLTLIAGNMSLTSLAVTIGEERLSYVQYYDGLYDTVLYSNESVNGKVVNKVPVAWTTPAYVGIDSTQSQTTEWLPAPPKGQLLELFNGRLFVAVGNLLYFSATFDYSRFQALAPFVFSSRILMLASVLEGLYVGTEDAVFYLAGADPNEFRLVHVYDGGVVYGSNSKLTAENTALKTKSTVVVFAVRNEGICIGDSAGQVQNLTKLKVAFPDTSAGASFTNKNDQYILAMGV